METLFGREVADQMANAKVLLVGAGGIGCELLKDLILMNIGEIHVLDLDTIDLSNLNRQFLFRQKDIKQSKSLTAVKAVKHFNLKSKLIPYHGNIMDSKSFPLSFFSQFTIIYNALDNLEARLYVNKMALFTKVPLYESGTTGFKGQVQPIYPYLSECFHCMPKETPKTFPVCTIRSTPSKPIHSITWAKNFLLPQLFGERDTDTINLSDFTNKEEADAKMKEANELNDLKESIFDRSRDNEDLSLIYNILEKIYQHDIEKLISIDALWETRKKPNILPDLKKLINMNDTRETYLNMKFNAQEVNNLTNQIQLFIKSVLKLTNRVLNGEIIEFDKDDEDTLQFVVSSSNIRSYLFHIPQKSEFDIKQIAGNIIPAIATTNAIMAGFSALTSMQYFLNNDNEERARKSRMIYDSNSFDKVVNSTKLAPPNINCKSCSISRGVLKLDLANVTIGDLQSALIEKYGYEDDVEIISAIDSRLLYDYDMEDNLKRKLINMKINEGDILHIGDSEDVLDLIELYVENANGGESGIQLPDMKIPPKKVPNNDEEENEEEEEEDIIENVGVEKNGIINLDEDVSSLKRPLEREADEHEITNKKSKLNDKITDEEELIIL